MSTDQLTDQIAVVLSETDGKAWLFESFASNGEATWRDLRFPLAQTTSWALRFGGMSFVAHNYKSLVDSLREWRLKNQLNYQAAERENVGRHLHCPESMLPDVEAWCLKNLRDVGPCPGTQTALVIGQGEYAYIFESTPEKWPTWCVIPEDLATKISERHGAGGDSFLCTKIEDITAHLIGTEEKHEFTKWTTTQEGKSKAWASYHCPETLDEATETWCLKELKGVKPSPEGF